MKTLIVYFSKPLIWLLLICYGLYLPADKLPSSSLFNIPYFDKIVHFTLFFILSLLLVRPFKKLGLKPYIPAFLIAMSLGLLLESVQHLISTSRNSDFFDFAANTCGAAFSILSYHLCINGKKWEKYF